MAVEVSKRIAVLALEAVRAQPDLPPRPPPRTPDRATTERCVQRALAETRHHVVMMPNGSWHCRKCLSRSSAQRRHQADWLLANCSSDEAAPGVKSSRPQLTHALSSTDEGLAWCIKCGSWSGGVYRALRGKCLDVPKTALQRLCVKRLAQGLKPPGLDHTLCKPQQQCGPDSLFVVGLDDSSESN